MKKTAITLSLCAFVSANAQTTLDPVTITSATKSEQSIKDTTSNVTVITSEELEEKHIQTLPQALNLVSGISITANGGMGSQSSVNLRGSDNKRVLVLVDGIRYQDPTNTSGSQMHHLMISNIERIEIIKGAQSGIWGADASAGVINIITKKAQKGTNANVRAEYGSFNTKKYGAFLSHKQKNFDVLINADRVTTDSFTSKAPKGEDIDQYEDDPYENTTVNVRSNYYINDNAKLSLGATVTDALKDYDSFGNPDDDLLQSDYQSRLYNLRYEQVVQSHTIVLKTEQSRFENKNIGTTFGVDYSEGRQKNYELSDRFNYMPDSFLVFGGGLSEDEVDYTKVSGASQDHTDKNRYIYLTNSNRFSDTVITQSLRYDRYDAFENEWTGKAGIKHSVKKLDLFANAGRGYNVPNIMQKLNPWGDSNMNLAPEKARTYEAGFTYGGFEFTYFTKKITDLIQWQGAGYENLEGQNDIKGFELAYTKALFSDWFLKTSYTRLHAQDAQGDELARRPKENLKFGIDYYGIQNLHLGLFGEYVGQRYDEAGKQGTQTGRYTVIDFAMNYEINNNTKIYAKVDNINDKYYQQTDGYATSPRAYYTGVKVAF